MNLIKVEPYPFTFTTRMKTKWNGWTILEIYSKQFPYKPKDFWKNKIHSGQIKVNGSLVDVHYVPKSSDLFEHHVENRSEPDVPADIQILKETEHYLAVSKPAPMPVHPCGRYYKNSLINILKERGFSSLYLTHRLDALTSGIIIFAKNSKWASIISEEFKAGRVNKKYLAKVSGDFYSEISVYLAIRRSSGTYFECHPDGKIARTYFRKISFKNGFSLVECTPLTGKTHQIRLHLNALGFPISNDPKYGNYKSLSQDEPIYLHAYLYNFLDQEIKAPLPHWSQLEDA